MPLKSNLFSVWKKAAACADPAALFKNDRLWAKNSDSACIFWGKAAARTWQALGHPARSLVISPESPPRDSSIQAISASKNTRSANSRRQPSSPRFVQWIQSEHPLPGAGSFGAGEALLRFFEMLREQDVRQLRVYLSGGASSLAWIRPALISPQELERELERLYALPLPIQELNRRRSKLCALKGGGAAMLLQQIAPFVQCQVRLLSDVAPFGPETIGSGPFWLPHAELRPEHRVFADNPTLTRRLALEWKRATGERVSLLRHSWVARWEDWAQCLDREIAARWDARSGPAKNELLLIGGEPLVELPSRPHPGAKGGRQAHLATWLLSRYAAEVAQGRIEILCACSDGVDGRSGGGGAWIQARQLAGHDPEKIAAQARQSLKRFDSGGFLRGLGALIPAHPTGTNVQDAAMVRLVRD